MSVQILPIPPAVKERVQELMAQVQAELQPFVYPLTEAETKRLGSTAMGRESVPFAEEGQQLIANFPAIFPRTVTDEMLGAYPVQLASFKDADDLAVAVNTVADQLRAIKLVTGNAVMKVARGGYKNGQDDNGQTPGVKTIIDEMGKLYRHEAPVEPLPPVPPAA